MDNRAAAAHRDAAAEPLLDVRALKKYYPVTSGFFQRKQGTVRAVDDVSFTIYKGETFGLVGESGCGKSTLGRCILRLQEPTSGEVLFEGRNILTLSNRAMNSIRRKMQIVFQDPYSSLNPRMTVWQTLHEPLFLHGITGRSVIRKRVLELLDLVGLGEHHLHRFPHEFSGGQRQRIGIARALALHPQLIVCDEPVSALDVSVQSQVLNLLSDLQAELGLTY